MKLTWNQLKIFKNKNKNSLHLVYSDVLRYVWSELEFECRINTEYVLVHTIWTVFSFFLSWKEERWYVKMVAIPRSIKFKEYVHKHYNNSLFWGLIS